MNHRNLLWANLRAAQPRPMRRRTWRHFLHDLFLCGRFNW
jgi:hypothetical protein